jgi:hypothetical protein
MSASPYPQSEYAERSGAAAAVRTAVKSLFARAGAQPASNDASRLLESIAPHPDAIDRRIAAARDTRRRAARAAHATVEKGGDAALNAAIDLLVDEIELLERRSHNQAEALKAVQLYAPETWVRRLAEQALAKPDCAAPALPTFLAGNEIGQAKLQAMAVRHIG